MEDEILEKIKLKIAISEVKKENDIAMKRRKKIINRNIGIAACFAVIFSGIVYAKDIENYFKKIFNNSTEAIDKAVENGYVQQENMDYTYDKDIGIKVDSLILDDLNLDISFNFEIKKENVKSIRFSDFTITNDKNKVVFRSEFKYAETLEELPIYNSADWGNEPVKLTDTTYADSILLGLRPEKEDFEKLYFDIKSVQIIYVDDTQEIVEGNWKFDLAISEEMRQSNNIIYTLLEENEYVKSATATLSPTGVVVELDLKVEVNPRDAFLKVQRGEEICEEDVDLFYLKYNSERYSPSSIFPQNTLYTKYKIYYDNVEIFWKEIEKFELYLAKFDISIILDKK